VNPNYFIHAANVLLLVAYTVRDILWLRLFAVAAALTSIPYFALQPTPLWEALGWTVLFAAINLFQTWRLLLERQPVKLTAEEEHLRKLAFGSLPPRKFLQVLSIGAWTTAKTGERLLERGKAAKALSLIIHGKVRVTRDEQVLGELVPGDIVGSVLILTGAPADVDAVVVEDVRSMRWEVEPLDRYLAGNPETRLIMQNYLARDMAEKLTRTLSRAHPH
jgi:CRP-like cAMP-binding protein